MIMRGLWLLATGRPGGIKEFSASMEGLTASLGPLIAFPLVGAAITAYQGQPELAALAFLARLCAVLAVPLLTFEAARLMRREALWMRTATALNWSFWMVVPLIFIAAVAGALLVTAGLDQTRAEYAAMGMILGYLLWFQWFAIRSGLQISRFKAALLVIVMCLAVAVLTAGPMMVGLITTPWAHI